MRSRGLSPHYRGTCCFLEWVLSLSSPCARLLRTQADSRRAHGARYAPSVPNAMGHQLSALRHRGRRRYAQRRCAPLGAHAAPPVFHLRTDA